ncbi:putative RNA-dependent RNA polymerase 4 [Silene latifolia]|uniref:putative RNA-dependent RNA polymerase 4 n=1 Tax=Silene latifolia TaxID=37657 RepID=UPI003D788C7F
MGAACTLDDSLKKESAACVIHKYKQSRILERILYGADDLDKSPRSWDDIRLDALELYRVTYDHAIQTGKASYCGFAWRVAGSALLNAFVDDQSGKPVTCVLSVLRQLVI